MTTLWPLLCLLLPPTVSQSVSSKWTQQGRGRSICCVSMVSGGWLSRCCTTPVLWAAEGTQMLLNFGQPALALKLSMPGGSVVADFCAWGKDCRQCVKFKQVFDYPEKRFRGSQTWPLSDLSADRWDFLTFWWLNKRRCYFFVQLLLLSFCILSWECRNLLKPSSSNFGWAMIGISSSSQL